MTISGYQPVQTMRLIARTLERELNKINPQRLFTARTVDVNWDEFLDNTGWARSGRTNGGICHVKVKEGGETFSNAHQPQAMDTYTQYLVRTAVPIFGQRANEDNILDEFVELVMSKIVEVGACNQAWLDENGNSLTWDSTVITGGCVTTKTKDNAPLFIFDYYYKLSNTFRWSAI
jgi:hypothetical protein